MTASPIPFKRPASLATLRFARRTPAPPLPILAGQVFEYARPPIWPRWALWLGVMGLLMGFAR